MALSITTMNTDVFVRILSFLNAEDCLNIPYVSKYFNQVSDSESCKALWISASKKLGIISCLPGKTWKQTFCRVNDRFENRKYFLSYVTKSERPYNPHSRLTTNFIATFRTREGNYDSLTVSHKQKKLLWGNAGKQKSFPISFPNNSILAACARHGSLLALKFDFLNQKFNDHNVLQVWDIEKERKILEHHFIFSSSVLEISNSEVALNLSPTGCFRSPPAESAIFDCSRENAILDFKTAQDNRMAARTRAFRVCVIVFVLLALMTTVYNRGSDS